MERQYIPEKQKQIPDKEMKISAAGAPEKKPQKEDEETLERKIKTPEKEDKAKEEKKAEDKKKIEEKPKKTEAVVNGKDLGISTKHSIAICKAIKGKKIDEAVYLLEQVSKMKKAIPMNQEIGHRKGMAGGRYPIKASLQFIKLLKQLAANATVNGLELEKARIECKADLASRPYKRGGSMRFKRTHVTLKLRIREKKKPREEKENKNKENKIQQEK